MVIDRHRCGEGHRAMNPMDTITRRQGHSQSEQRSSSDESGGKPDVEPAPGPSPGYTRCHLDHRDRLGCADGFVVLEGRGLVIGRRADESLNGYATVRLRFMCTAAPP
jgi:hypothetical protein